MLTGGTSEPPKLSRTKTFLDHAGGRFCPWRKSHVNSCTLDQKNIRGSRYRMQITFFLIVESYVSYNDEFKNNKTEGLIKTLYLCGEKSIKKGYLADRKCGGTTGHYRQAVVTESTEPDSNTFQLRNRTTCFTS